MNLDDFTTRLQEARAASETQPPDPIPSAPHSAALRADWAPEPRILVGIVNRRDPRVADWRQLDIAAVTHTGNTLYIEVQED